MIIAAVLCLGALTTAPAQADSMTWQLRSYSRYTVDVKLFSQNRRNVWPSASSSWQIRDYGVHKFAIRCVAGERICFGAAIEGSGSSVWGQGLSGKRACENCCYRCEDGAVTKVINLNER
jgi:hypothetical protein